MQSKYWDFIFNAVDPNTFSLKINDKWAELVHLIEQAVLRRLPRSGKAWCSLSGGADSRSIIASLIANINEKPISLTALTYGLETDDDPLVAKELCNIYGIDCKSIMAKHSIHELINLNGKYCEGMVFFYFHSLSGMERIKHELAATDTLFVGDECGGWPKRSLSSLDDVLSKLIGIRAPANVPSYFSYGNTPHNQITEQLQEEINEIKAKTPKFNSFHDQADYLFVDQRLPGMLLPWREFHFGRYIRVSNPLIDQDVMEFYRSVPTEFRENKRLFMDAMRYRHPHLFGHRFARSGGNNMQVLEKLFLDGGKGLESMVDSFDSGLDEVIPPDIVMAGLIEMLDRLRLQGADLSPRVRNLAEWLRRKFTKARIYLAGPVRGAKSGSRHGLMSLSPLQMATLLQLRSMLKPRVQGAFTR
jgi:hypothetical protein